MRRRALRIGRQVGWRGHSSVTFARYCNSTPPPPWTNAWADHYGVPAPVVSVQVVHYTLYRALRSVFQWAAAHVPLAVQHVPDMPFADAAWPDVRDTAHMAAAVEAALTDPTQLGEVGTGVRVATEGRVDPGTFAALVPRIAATLSELHRDLPAIWDLAKQMYDSRWIPTPRGSATDVASLRRAKQLTTHQGSDSGVAAVLQGADPHERQPQQQYASASHKLSVRRRVQAIPPNYNYTLPPNFQPRPPAGRPPLLIPIVVHVLGYMDGDAYIPAGLSDSPASVDLWLQVANAALKPANIQLFAQVRAGLVGGTCISWAD